MTSGISIGPDGRHLSKSERASVIRDGEAMTADDALQLLFGGIPSQRKAKHAKREEGEPDGREVRAKLVRAKKDAELVAYFAGEPVDPAAFDESHALTSCPSPEDIRKECLEIQKEWSDYEREQRTSPTFRALAVAFNVGPDPAERDTERAAWRNFLYGGRADLMRAWSEALNDGREFQ